MIDTLFTDLGDVMFLFDFKIFEQEVIRRTNRVPEKLQWEQSSILKQAFTGRVSGKQFLETRARELGVEPHEITEIWDRAVAPNEPYLEFLKYWKKGENKLYLLSNINVAAWNYYRGQPVFELFDDVFLSYRLRLAKPDPRVFRACIKKAGVEPQRVLFVDDLQANVDAAARIGMATWLYRPQTHASFLDFVSSLPKPLN